LWLKQQLENYGINVNHIHIKCNNFCAVNLSKNLVHHSRTKHIEIRHHFIKDHVQRDDIALEYVPAKNQLANFFYEASGEKLVLKDQD